MEPRISLSRMGDRDRDSVFRVPVVRGAEADQTGEVDGLHLTGAPMRILLTLSLIASAAAAQQPAAKQPPDPNDPRVVLHGGLREVQGWITKSVEMVPADKFTYKPVGTVRSFGELAAHVADGLNWYCANAAGKKTEWSDAIEKGKTDKATVTAALTAAFS